MRADGARVVTIEGLGSDEALHPIQDAFARPKALLDEHPRPTDHEIREFLSGNFCRCAGYNLIVSAVRDAASLRTESR